jgi:hypothetical protein
MFISLLDRAVSFAILGLALTVSLATLSLNSI